MSNEWKYSEGYSIRFEVSPVKLVLEIVISWLLHPLAVILAWINIARRSDLRSTQKVIWAVVCVVWGLGPTLYILVGDGAFW